MRIERRVRTEGRAEMLSVQIEAAAAARPVEGRVCGEHCAATCALCGSTRCQCRCSAQCPDAPRALSCDPNHFSIEPAIAPLVFEMKRLSMFEPCWSCEGHIGADGKLHKSPSVWFYCTDPVHLRLLNAGLQRLKYSGALKAPWRIAVTFSDADNPDATFVLEPALERAPDATLADVQHDAARIAAALRALMSSEARALREGVNL